MYVKPDGRQHQTFCGDVEVRLHVFVADLFFAHSEVGDGEFGRIPYFETSLFLTPSLTEVTRSNDR